ncbi:hypothetical protein EYJ43_28350, partial [Salmonella enterica]|nr:hypothetical protein [Salmonella enterica]
TAFFSSSCVIDRFACGVKIQPHYRTLSGKISVSVHRLRISSVPTANLCHSAEKNNRSMTQQ